MWCKDLVQKEHVKCVVSGSVVYITAWIYYFIHSHKGSALPRLACWVCIPLFQKTPWGWLPHAARCRHLILVINCILISAYIGWCINPVSFVSEGTAVKNDKCEWMTVSGKHWVCQKQENDNEKWKIYVILLDPQNSKQKVTLIPVGKSLSGVLYKEKKVALVPVGKSLLGVLYKEKKVALVPVGKSLSGVLYKVKQSHFNTCRQVTFRCSLQSKRKSL